MTWTKLGTEFFDQLVDMDFPDDLDDACQLTHAQAIHYCYSVENMNLRFKKSTLPRFASSSRAELAAHALVKAGAWADHGKDYELIHHADVIRQSIAVQQRKRTTEKERMRRRRQGDPTTDVVPNVGSNVGANVGYDGAPTQTDRQTYRQRPVPAQNSELIDEQTGEITEGLEASLDIVRSAAGWPPKDPQPEIAEGRKNEVPPNPFAAGAVGRCCPECGNRIDRRSRSASCAHRHQGHPSNDEDAA